MNSSERLQKCLALEEPDRVPYDLGGTTTSAITRHAYVKAMEYRGIDPAIKTSDIDPIQQIITPSEENLNQLGVDTRRIGARRIPGFRWEDHKEEETIRVTDLYGCDWEYQAGKDLYFNQVSYPLEEAGSLSGALPGLKEIEWESYREFLEPDLKEQVAGTDAFGLVADRHTAGLTENSLRVRGYEKWYMDTVLDPAGVEALLERMMQDKLRYWDLLIDWALKEGVAEQIQVIAECDDLGNQETTILDPDQLREWVIPRLGTIFRHVKKRLPGVKIFFHTCGAVRELIPDLIEAGMDILNPVQFTAKGMELKELKRDFGDVLTFWGGGVDTQHTLNKGTPQEVSDEVKRILDIMAPGGGFVFTPVHNVQHDVSPENFWAMWDTMKEYGNY